MTDRTKYAKDPNEVETFRVKTYSAPELIIEVCREMELEQVLERPEANASFMVLHIITTQAKFRAARVEWVRRMSVSLPLPAAKEDIDLFA